MESLLKVAKKPLDGDPTIRKLSQHHHNIVTTPSQQSRTSLHTSAWTWFFQPGSLNSPRQKVYKKYNVNATWDASPSEVPMGNRHIFLLNPSCWHVLCLSCSCPGGQVQLCSRRCCSDGGAVARSVCETWNLSIPRGVPRWAVLNRFCHSGLWTRNPNEVYTWHVVM